MNVLVTGGTGTVGSRVVRELLARRADVAVLTRKASKARALPQGVRALEGDLHQVASLKRVFEGAEAVFLLVATGPLESDEGLMAVTAARDAGVKRIVYLSVHLAEQAAWLPHFGAKVGIEAALRASGIAHTVLRPNNFFQNDLGAKDALLQGLYPQPLGNVGLSRVDVRDIAEAAAIALTEPGHEGQTYDLVGPEVLTGPRTAELWSRALERPVAYVGDDLDAWEKQACQALPEQLAFDLRHMYAFFQERGMRASPEAIARQTRLLGHAPRAFEPFAAETAALWRRP